MSRLLFLIVGISIGGCSQQHSATEEIKKNEQNITQQAKTAATDYCNCVQENIFNYPNVESLYSHCNRIIAARYKLYKLKLEMDSSVNKELSTDTKDSIHIFIKTFDLFSDSCSSISGHKRQHQL